MPISRLMTGFLTRFFSLSILSTTILWVADKQPFQAGAVKVDITPSDLRKTD